MRIPWQSLSTDTQLDIALSETIRCGHWATIMHWATPGNAPSLVAAMAQRGVVWDHNALPAWQQRLYIETAAAHIRNDWHSHSVKLHLARMLDTCRAPRARGEPALQVRFGAAVGAVYS